MPELPIEGPGPKPPETRLPSDEADVRHSLMQALAEDQPALRRDTIAAFVADHPTSLDGWAALSEVGRDPIEAYAAARVGYHRGLDALRQNGWRGSGFVRWEHPGNRGFLKCLARLADLAETIGETGESERCRLFLRQLDPTWPPASLDQE